MSVKRVFKKADRPSMGIQRAAMAHGMSLYFVKYRGSIAVEESRGAAMVEYAIHQVTAQNKARKKEGWHAPKVELAVTAMGIKVTDRSNGQKILDVPLRMVSYCQDDRRGNDLFAFIAKMNPDAPRKCFVFKADNEADRILATMGNAFAKASHKNLKKTGSVKGGPASNKSDAELQEMRRKLRVQEMEAERMRERLATLEAQSQNSSYYGDEEVDPDFIKMDEEMKAMEREFENDFKFAMARTAALRPGGEGNPDEAFEPGKSPSFARKAAPAAAQAPAAAAAPPAAAALPTIDAAAFQAGGAGYGIAAPPARAQADTTANKPFARQRGAPPPTHVAATSQINMPARARGRPRPTASNPNPATVAVAAPPAARPNSDFDDGGDAFADLVATRSSKLVPEPEPAAAAPAGDDDLGLDDLNLDDVDNLVSALAEEAEDIGGDAAPEPEAESTGAPAMGLVEMCQAVWTQINPSGEECIGGGALRPTMMQSGLESSLLGEIWSLVDTEKLGQINYRQFGFIMGLLSQAQQGQPLDPSVIGEHTPAPTLAASG